MSSEVQASDGDPAPCIVTVVTSEEAFAALRNDWDDLHGRVPGAGGSQTFLYAWQGWARLNGKPASLRIVVARVGPKLVAIWPLCVVRETGARVARHLGCGDGAEYASPLIASHSQQLIGLAEALLSAADRACDVLEVHNLDAGSSLGLAIVARGRTMYRGAPASPIILLSGWADFDAWMGTRSKSFRTGLRYDRRRISAQGELIFRELGQAGAGSFIDWLMAEKGRWLDDRRIKRNWLRESRKRGFSPTFPWLM